MFEPQRVWRPYLLLWLLLVQQGVAVTATVTCRLHFEGYGHTTGLKAAHLACSGGVIKAAAHPILAPFKRSFSGVQWVHTDACGVGHRGCLLTFCGDTSAAIESATAAHINVSNVAQSLVCLGARSNVTFRGARFHSNTARCISVLQQPSNATVRLHLDKCNFTDNHAPVDVGGVLELAGGTALVEASTFSGNSARAKGGAIGVTNDAELTLISSLLQNNTGKGHGSAGLLVRHHFWHCQRMARAAR
jgi:predicted outer membrane repeat protein